MNAAFPSASSGALEKLTICCGGVPEGGAPAGGAQNDYEQASALVGQALSTALAEVGAMTVPKRLDARYEKFRRMGDVGFNDPGESSD